MPRRYEVVVRPTSTFRGQRFEVALAKPSGSHITIDTVVSEQDANDVREKILSDMFDQLMRKVV